MPMPEPITVHCVGSTEPGHALFDDSLTPMRMCKMCGDTIPDHERVDILAMLNRGDYG